MSAEKIALVPVDSSNIAALGYNREKQILAVQFKSGTIYHYAGVALEIAAQLVTAESRGAFYAMHIRGKFQGQRMTGLCHQCGAGGWIGDACEDCGTATYAPWPPKEPISE